MNAGGSSSEIDLLGSVTAFGRVAYTDLLTIVVVSVSFTVASIPLVTIGAAIIAAVETMTAVVTGEGRGGPTSERQRVGLFVASFRANLRRGVPYSTALVVVVATTSFYAVAATTRRSGLLFLGALLGFYAVVIAIAWLFRAASIAIRSGETVGFVDAVREGAYLALEYPWYAALHLITVGFVLLVSFAAPPAYALVVPGSLAVLEVIAFEETGGRGSVSLVRAYRGEFEE